MAFRLLGSSFAVCAAVIALVGCASSSDADCIEERFCYPLEGRACCDVSSAYFIRTSVCSPCPMGTAETCLERDEGCEDPCETRTTCLADLAEGCCGTRIEAATCDGTCPEGTRPDTECVSFPPECGCSMPAFVPIVQCREDLGDNHCGAIVGTPEIEGCGCPEGTLAEADCNTFE